MVKLNCWEYKNCGREPGGNNVESLGVCPASIETKVNKLNNGINGGRTCWAIKESCAAQKVLALHLAKCHECSFFKLVFEEEDMKFQDVRAILRRIA